VKFRIAALAVAATAALLVGACLTLSPEARAGSVPVTLPIGNDTPDTHFTLLGPTDVAEFRLNATAGQDLFVGLQTWSDLRMQVLDPSGKLVRTFDADGSKADSIEEGAEVHPLVSGAYAVRVAGQPDGFIEYPSTESTISAYLDCRGGPATKCAIAPGQTANATFGGSNDDDAYVIKGTTAGKRYAATIQVSNDFLYGTDLRLVDRDGKVLQSVATGNHAERRNNATLKFVLPKGGPFYLQEHPHPSASFNLRATFTLSLKQQ
jgi:hypothetical protein